LPLLPGLVDQLVIEQDIWAIADRIPYKSHWSVRVSHYANRGATNRSLRPDCRVYEKPTKSVLLIASGFVHLFLYPISVRRLTWRTAPQGRLHKSPMLAQTSSSSFPARRLSRLCFRSSRLLSHPCSWVILHRSPCHQLWI